MSNLIRAVSSVLVLAFFVAKTGGEVTRIEITSTEPFNEGASYGSVGTYEYLTGRVHYAVDPDHAANRGIVDLRYGPRDRDGRVAFFADLRILIPTDPSKASGTLFYTVNNRGRVIPVQAGNRAPGNLLDRGHTLVMSGWDAELLPDTTRLRLYAPVAELSDRPIAGLVRVEVATGVGRDTLLAVNGPGHGGYMPTKTSLDHATLTYRAKESAPRIQVDPSRFTIRSTPQSDPFSLPLIQLEMKGVFKPNQIYELIYQAKDPVIQGLCFAAVRDLVSFLRNDTSDWNPLHRKVQPVSFAIGYGVSQSGRFLRQFLYEGFNADKQGRRVFEGVIPLVSGGGMGCFNYRFASPTRTNTQHRDHLFPSDVFPFAYGDETNSLVRSTASYGERVRGMWFPRSCTFRRRRSIGTGAARWSTRILQGTRIRTLPKTSGSTQSAAPNTVRVRVCLRKAVPASIRGTTRITAQSSTD